MIKSPYDVIIKPLITEKSMAASAERKYSFKVAKNANKIEIKEAAEKIFGIKVAAVNTQNRLGKLRRQGHSQGYKSDWKKAIITLSEGSKTIEFFDSLM